MINNNLLIFEIDKFNTIFNVHKNYFLRYNLIDNNITNIEMLLQNKMSKPLTPQPDLKFKKRRIVKNKQTASLKNLIEEFRLKPSKFISPQKSSEHIRGRMLRNFWK